MNTFNKSMYEPFNERNKFALVSFVGLVPRLIVEMLWVVAAALLIFNLYAAMYKDIDTSVDAARAYVIYQLQTPEERVQVAQLQNQVVKLAHELKTTKAALKAALVPEPTVTEAFVGRSAAIYESVKNGFVATKDYVVSKWNSMVASINK